MKRPPEFTPPENPAPNKCYRSLPPPRMTGLPPPGNLRGRGRGRGGQDSRGRSHNSLNTGELDGSFSGFSDEHSPSSCGLCRSTVGNDCVGCDRCLVWYHPKCTGLGDQALQCIANEGGQGIAFICSSCRFSQPYSPDNLDRLNQPVSQESVNQLFQMIKAVTISVASLHESLKTQSEKCSGSHQCNLDDNALYTKFFEFEDRKRRKDSIIIRGIQAANTSQFSSMFEQVTEKIMGEKLAPENPHCIDQNKFIFRAVISNRENRIRVLQNAKKLKNDTQFSNVYINRDLTYQQRKEARDRRAETRQRRNPADSSSQLNLSGGNRTALGSRGLATSDRGRADGPPNDNLQQIPAAAATPSRVIGRLRSQSNPNGTTQGSHASPQGAAGVGGF